MVKFKQHVLFTPTLQKPEGFRVKASEGEVVVLYFEPSATQDLKSSGFPEGGTTWQNRLHPSNSPMDVSRNSSFYDDNGNNCGSLSNLCQVVYASKGLNKLRYYPGSNTTGGSMSPLFDAGLNLPGIIRIAEEHMT